MSLAVPATLLLARYVRTLMLEALREEYVVAAPVKGGTMGTALVRHVLRNSFIPLLMGTTLFVALIFGVHRPAG
ncbi:ABC transporter permease subunit [Nonomuraea turcica]|uniref:ABC transporter permease subunit n=1 Tax=Nonomuraea sp. G32 TaxID=3067274 RepID=UPI00273BA578|nr:ABC transporter permease subunit [Nonomuraea sp. G32]MDP4502462.1 ABC transporter permease subunit [Nonomuraea sp. G32]